MNAKPIFRYCFRARKFGGGSVSFPEAAVIFAAGMLCFFLISLYVHKRQVSSKAGEVASIQKQPTVFSQRVVSLPAHGESSDHNESPKPVHVAKTGSPSITPPQKEEAAPAVKQLGPSTPNSNLLPPSPLPPIETLARNVVMTPIGPVSMEDIPAASASTASEENTSLVVDEEAEGRPSQIKIANSKRRSRQNDFEQSGNKDPNMIPRLTKADSVKGFWWRSLPRNQPNRAAFCKSMEDRLRSGFYDMDAESTAIEWNMREYQRVGDTAMANSLSEKLAAIRVQIEERDHRRETMELKRKEIALKEEEIDLKAVGIISEQMIAKSLNRIAFQMLIGNAIEADANGMTLHYWESVR